MYKRCLLFFVLFFCFSTPPQSIERFAAAEESSVLQLHQINVHCADAYLILLDDIAVMIDGGNDVDQSPDRLMAYLAAAGFDHLTAYFVTHYHDDHAGNLKLIMWTYGTTDTVVYGPSRKLPSVYGPLTVGKYRQLRDCDAFSIGPLHVLCVGPDSRKCDGKKNVDSLNFIIAYGERRFLFTGDFAHSGAYLQRHAEDVRNVDVLKFPHHGLEPFAIDNQALRLVNPSVILVPGANAMVCDLVRRESLHASVYGINGHTVVLTDGQTLEVVTDVERGQFAD